MERFKGAFHSWDFCARSVAEMRIANPKENTAFMLFLEWVKIPNEETGEFQNHSMKNVVKLENYYFPEELKMRLEEFIDFYNNKRYHESLSNLTPADVYFGRDKEILRKRKLTKLKTIKMRRKLYEEQKLRL